MSHYVDDGLPIPLLCTSTSTDPLNICTELAHKGFRSVEVVLVVLNTSINHVPEGYTRFYTDELPANFAQAWVSSDLGASIFFIKCMSNNMLSKPGDGTSASFSSKLLGNIQVVLRLITDRVMHGRVVAVSGVYPEEFVKLLLEHYRQQLPSSSVGCAGAMECTIEEAHGMLFACVNGHSFNDCSPGFRTSSLLSCTLVCPLCIAAEGAEYAAHVTAMGDDFHTNLNFIAKQRGFKVADESNILFAHEGLCQGGHFFDMSTDMGAQGNGKVLRWQDARYGRRKGGILSEQDRRTAFAGCVDPTSQFQIKWSFDQRYFLVAKSRIEPNSLMCGYGSSIIVPGDYISDCLFKVASVFQSRPPPFFLSCHEYRNEASFIACCGVGDRANIVTQFVKGKGEDGDFFCGLLMKTGSSAIEAGTPFAYQ